MDIRQIKHTLRDHEMENISEARVVQAAVLVPLVERDGVPHILFEGSKDYIDTYDKFICGIDSGEGYDTSRIAQYYDITETPAHVRLADKLEEYINDKNDIFRWTHFFLMKSKWWMIKRSSVHMIAILANLIDKYLLKMDGVKSQNIITKIFSSRTSKLISRNRRKQRFEIDKETVFKKLSFDEGE